MFASLTQTQWAFDFACVLCMFLAWPLQIGRTNAAPAAHLRPSAGPLAVHRHVHQDLSRGFGRRRVPGKQDPANGRTVIELKQESNQARPRAL